LNRVLEAVDLDRIAGRIVVGRKAPVVLPSVADTRDLPAAHDLLHDASGVAEQLLTASERQFRDEVPTDLVLRRIRIALVVQEMVSLAHVRRNRARQEGIDAGHRVDALRVVGVAVQQIRVPDIPENLITEAMMEAPLE